MMKHNITTIGNIIETVEFYIVSLAFAKWLLDMKHKKIMEHKINPEVMIIGFLIMSFCMLSCNENSAEKYGLRFELAVLNNDLESVLTFQEGDPIIFQLLVVNESGKDLSFRGFDSENVFRVFKISGSGREDMGRPYSTVGCEYILGYPLDAGDSTIIRIPWIPKNRWSEGIHRILCGLKYENAVLQTGIYETTLNSRFIFGHINEEFTIHSPNQTIMFNIK